MRRPASSTSLDPLPIDALLPDVLEALSGDRAAVVQAPPGSGKTTRLPLGLLDAPWLEGQKILVLEPRRVAATTAARRMAHGLGQRVGDTVGYRVRLDTKVGPTTRVEVMTDGLFLRRLIQDPDLAGVGCVIFDEFHERGLNSDLSLALLLEVRELLRPELAVVVMSATINGEAVAELLGGAPLLQGEGRSFPVDVRYMPQGYGDEFQDHVQRAVSEALAATDGDVLVFLPGKGEIKTVEQALSDVQLPGNVQLAPLHGDLPLEDQEIAIRLPADGWRKVVLSTAIAESSLTIEGVTAVVDTGLARRNQFDARRGMDELVTQEASQASAEQRRGRAGRVRPGLCIRLWAEREQALRVDFDPPELTRCDMAPLALTMASWGAVDADELQLLDPIDPKLLEQGQALLRQFGALDGRNVATAHGQALAGLGAHPRIAHMLLQAGERGLGTLGARLAVLLSERDPLDRRDAGSDIALRLLWFQGELGGADKLRGRFHSLAQDLGRQAGLDVHRGPLPKAELAAAGELVAAAYPERVALASSEGRGWLMAMGRRAHLSGSQALASSRGLAIAMADAKGESSRILYAARLTLAQIRSAFEHQLRREQRLWWDGQSQRVKGCQELRLGALVLETEPATELDPVRSQQLLLKALTDQDLRPLPWNERARSLQQRMEFAHRHLPDEWPDRSASWLRDHVDAWLGDQLTGVTRFRDLRDLSLEEALWGDTPWDKRQQFDALLPRTCLIPSGRAVPIDYSGQQPVVAAKLQEFFGSRETPSVLGGKVLAQLHLLSPAGRPLQVTSNLAQFWEGSYVAVRKETRGRYPKHPWPEDPANAEPTSLSKKALQRRQHAQDVAS